MKDTGHKDPFGETQGEWFYATRVWNTGEKDYDPCGGLPITEGRGHERQDPYVAI
jgi:hypothetical protein